MTHPRALPGLLALVASATAGAAGLPARDLEEVVVSSRRLELVGPVESASQGIVVAEQLEYRPTQRPAEILEVVPGLVVTQHSGDGKANQYFLRGFNLDHGTDFATRVDGVPVNLPSHAHGQGYTDLNFLIPELVDSIEYRKGTYYAEEGDFSAAGSADIRYRRRIEGAFATISGGQDGYARAVLAGSPALSHGDLVLGAEYFQNDGPWDLKEGLRKLSGLAKYTNGDAGNGFEVAAMAYRARWRSSDQIPLRAVDEGIIDRFGTIDPTDGGDTHRYGISAAGWRTLGTGKLRGSLYAVDYGLDLYSDFTFALDPVHGDQFEQYDQRHVYGGALAYERPLSVGGREGTVHAGLEFRDDDIAPVALYRTVQRVRYATVREDEVRERSSSLYASETVHLTPWLRADAGLRLDDFRFAVASSLAANSGDTGTSVASPKLAVTFGPWSKTEYFLDVGRGFHSNDARGTTLTVDPNDGVTPVPKVTPLARALGAEVGLRSAFLPHVQFAASLWTLKLDSELVFSGDGGTTEASRASRRNGVELGALAAPAGWLVVDADIAWTRARYVDASTMGDRIPNAVGSVVSLGVTASRSSGWYGGARLRYFGPAPLVEDDSRRSSSTLIVNLEAGYHFSPLVQLTLTLFNVLDRHDNDVTYYYASRLPGEPAPVDDFHFHPVEPRTLRAALTLRLP